MIEYDDFKDDREILWLLTPATGGFISMAGTKTKTKHKTQNLLK